MQWREKTFRPVRRRACKRWLKDTQRSRARVFDDDFSSGMECRWQFRAEDAGRKHIALFCGVGEWASHITDLLSDPSSDNLRYDNAYQQRRLSRHYFRLMFVIAELLNDFEDALKKIGITDGRARLSGVVSVNDFQAFINQVVKHKAKALHRHDHHLPIVFSDASASGEALRVMRLGERDFSGSGKFDSILVPSLDCLLSVVFDAYAAFDREIEDEDVFMKICDEYEAAHDPSVLPSGEGV